MLEGWEQGSTGENPPRGVEPAARPVQDDGLGGTNYLGEQAVRQAGRGGGGRDQSPVRDKSGGLWELTGWEVVERDSPQRCQGFQTG